MQTILHQAEEALIQTALAAKPHDPQEIVVVRLDRLSPLYKNHYQLKTILHVIQDALRDENGHLYIAQNRAFYFVFPYQNHDRFEKISNILTTLCERDPNFDALHKDFCESFSLIHYKSELFKQFPYVANTLRKFTLRQELKDHTPPDIHKLYKRLHGLFPDTLDQCFTASSVCTLAPHAPLEKLVENITISTIPLEDKLALNTEKNHPIRYIIEEHSLHWASEALAKKQLRFPLNLPLSLKQTGSEDFSEFISQIPHVHRSQVMIEHDVSDIITNMRSFKNSVARITDAGLLLCIGGFDYHSITHIQLGQFNADMIKLHWNNDFRILEDDEFTALTRTIRDFGHNRIILASCHDSTAIEYGSSLGFSLFEGSYLENILEEQHQKIA